MDNRLKAKLDRGEKGIGTFFELGGGNAVECIAAAGLDFLIIDSEHGAFSAESAAELIRTACYRKITPLVRISDGSRPSVLKMLDVGARGLIVPSIETVEEVRELILYAKYPPLGNRGVMWGREALWGAADYAARGLDHYFKISNERTLLLPQCETLGSLTHIEEITALDGVDGIFVGPFDLSVALDAPGDFESDAFKEAMDRILRACEDAEKPAMIFAGDAETARKFLDAGYHAVAVSMDTQYLIGAYREMKASIDEN